MLPDKFRAIFYVFQHPRGGGPLSVSLGCHTKRLPADPTARGDEKIAKKTYIYICMGDLPVIFGRLAGRALGPQNQQKYVFFYIYIEKYSKN